MLKQYVFPDVVKKWGGQVSLAKLSMWKVWIEPILKRDITEEATGMNFNS